MNSLAPTTVRRRHGPASRDADRGHAPVLRRRRTRQDVELRWRTAQETEPLGFNVYRSGVKLNRTLIVALEKRSFHSNLGGAYDDCQLGMAFLRSPNSTTYW